LPGFRLRHRAGAGLLGQGIRSACVVHLGEAEQRLEPRRLSFCQGRRAARSPGTPGHDAGRCPGARSRCRPGRFLLRAPKAGLSWAVVSPHSPS
jgi:hypothetical protein